MLTCKKEKKKETPFKTGNQSMWNQTAMHQTQLKKKKKKKKNPNTSGPKNKQLHDQCELTMTMLLAKQRFPRVKKTEAVHRTWTEEH